MIEYFGTQYVPVEPDFFAPLSFEVAPRLIGCVLSMDYRGGDVAIGLSDLEAYDEIEGAFHDAPSQRLAHGHAYVHPYRRSKMWAIDLVCGPKGHGSSVLIRAGIPLVGLEIMAARRSRDPAADRIVRSRAKGYEKRISHGPCAVGEALDVQPALDGAWLFEKPFRIYRPVKAIADIDIGKRLNITKDAQLPWRWKWRNPPLQLTRPAGGCLHSLPGLAGSDV